MSADESYFAELSAALAAAGLHRPCLVLDLARLGRNVAAIRQGLDERFALRLVDKSLACLPLLEHLAEAFGTHRFMSFHLPVSAAVLDAFPEAELLLGKPMPAEAAKQFLERHKAAGGRVTWLIDTEVRLAEYAALADALKRDLEVAFEVDIGLHRGGFATPEDLRRALAALDRSPRLACTGIMGYEAHIGHIPGWLGGPKAARAEAMKRLAGFLDCLGPDQRHIVNTGGSTTALLYGADSAATEVALGSACVLPSDFDVPSLAGLEPAAYIATPILKVVEPQAPGLDGRTRILQALGLFPKRACYLYGGKWMASPVHPAGMAPNKTMGVASNQQFMALPADSPARPGDHAFLRPTQSEFVLQQFGAIQLYDRGRIVGEWPALPPG